MGKLSSILSRDINSITYDKCCEYWAGLNIQTAEDYISALDNFKVLFACNNCQIEGIDVSYHTTRELFEKNSVTSYSGDMNNLVAVCNQKMLFTRMISDLSNKVPLSTNLVKDYHKILMRGLYDGVRYNKGERAGQFKKGDYCVGVSDVGSFPEDVEEELNELMEEVNCEYTGPDQVITAAAYMHAVFECIHPFADGNGRIGRMVVNYFLMLKGLPPINIFDEDKMVYYMALEVYDNTEDISVLVQFLKEQMVKTWKGRVR